MYPVSSAVQALFESGSRQVAMLSGALNGNNQPISLSEADIVQGGLVVDRYTSSGGNELELGTAIAAECSFILYNGDGRHDDTQVLGRDISVSIGTADWTQTIPSVTLVPLGIFTITNVQKRQGSIVYTGYDYMRKLDKEVPWTTSGGVTIVDPTETGITSPMSLWDMVGAICTYCGVTRGDTEAANYLKTYSCTIPYTEGLNFRTVIQWAAFLMATNAYIDHAGVLQFGRQKTGIQCASWDDPSPIASYLIDAKKRFSSTINYLHEAVNVGGFVYTSQDGSLSEHTILPEYLHNHTMDYGITCGWCPLLTKEEEVADDGARLSYIANSAFFMPNAEMLGLEDEFSYMPFEAEITPAPWLWPMDAVLLPYGDQLDHIEPIHYGQPPNNPCYSTLTNVTIRLNDHTIVRSVGNVAGGGVSATNTSTQSYVLGTMQNFLTPLIYLDKEMGSVGLLKAPTHNEAIESYKALRLDDPASDYGVIMQRTDMTGANKNCYIGVAQNSATGYGVNFGIGADGIERGLYDRTNSSASGHSGGWMVKMDADLDKVKIPHDLVTKKVTSESTDGYGLVYERSTGDVYSAYSKRTDTGNSVSFGIGSGGTNRGIYAFSNTSTGFNGNWMLYMGSALDRVFVPWILETKTLTSPIGNGTAQSYVQIVPMWNNAALGLTSSTSNPKSYMNAWTQKVIATYGAPSVDTIFIGTTQANSRGFAIWRPYPTTSADPYQGNVPKYGTGLYVMYSHGIYTISHESYTLRMWTPTMTEYTP